MMSHWQHDQSLRRWQAEALEAWKQANHRGIASVVTGAGKTIFAEACMLEFAKVHPQHPIVIIVPTIALIDQWFVSLTEDLHVPVEGIAIFAGDRVDENPRSVNLVVLDRARHLVPRMFAQSGGMLVVDEVHRAGSPVNSRSLEGPWLATLGLSATPEREYDNALEEVLIPQLGPVIYEYGYESASRDGVIAPFSLVNVRILMYPDEQERYDALSRKIAVLLRKSAAGQDPSDHLKRLLQQRAAVSASARMRLPVSVKLVDSHRESKVIVFHESIAAAESIASMLDDRGRRVGLYHSRLGSSLRRDNLKLFRRGALDALVTCRALDEGINVPDASVAVIASSTASKRQRIQRFGRVLRPATGKREATVYTLFATDVEERRLAEEAETELGASSIMWMRGG